MGIAAAKGDPHHRVGSPEVRGTINTKMTSTTPTIDDKLKIKLYLNQLVKLDLNLKKLSLSLFHYN